MATAEISIAEPPVHLEWKDFLEEMLPAQGSWSEEEYLVLTDHRNRLVEFTDGVLEPLPMPTELHQWVLAFLYRAFFQHIDPRGGLVFFSPLRLQIRPGKYREPDLIAILAANDSRRQNRFWTGADLVVEVVSPDKPQRDLVEKPVDYAEGGIPEYWIVNPQDMTITVLRLEIGAYREAGKYTRGDTAKSVLLPDFAVDVTAVFKSK